MSKRTPAIVEAATEFLAIDRDIGGSQDDELLAMAIHLLKGVLSTYNDCVSENQLFRHELERLQELVSEEDFESIGKLLGNESETAT